MLNEDNVVGFIIFGTIGLSLLLIYAAGRWENRKVHESVQSVKRVRNNYQRLMARLVISSEVVKGERK